MDHHILRYLFWNGARRSAKTSLDYNLVHSIARISQSTRGSV
jgi:hypothetical protein